MSVTHRAAIRHDFAAATVMCLMPGRAMCGC